MTSPSELRVSDYTAKTIQREQTLFQRHNNDNVTLSGIFMNKMQGESQCDNTDPKSALTATSSTVSEDDFVVLKADSNVKNLQSIRTQLIKNLSASVDETLKVLSTVDTKELQRQTTKGCRV